MTQSPIKNDDETSGCEDEFLPTDSKAELLAVVRSTARNGGTVTASWDPSTGYHWEQ
jgi:hypothetical protein